MRLFGKPKYEASKEYNPINFKSLRTFEGLPNIGWKAKFRPFSKKQAVQEGLTRSTWVYSCVKIRAANVSSVPWIVERRGPDGWEPLDTHPLIDLINRPNPSFDWSEMMRRAVYNLDLAGDTYLSKIRANSDGLPRELWPLVPDRMDVLPGRDRMVRLYKYTREGKTVDIEAGELVHLKYTHPDDLYFGLPPLEASSRAVDIDEEAERWQKTSLQNMGVPPSVITMLSESVNQQEYEQTRQWVKEQSGASHAREPWVLANARMETVAQNAVDLDFVNGRKMTREEILSAYSVPPPLVGIYENATLANIETARQILWREGLIPVLDEIEGQLNLQLAGDYGSDIRMRYDLSNVESLRENLTEKLTEAAQLWGMGVPLAEINRRLELGLNTDDIEGAEVGYIPSSVFPVGEDVEPDDTPGGNEAAEGVFGDDTEES